MEFVSEPGDKYFWTFLRDYIENDDAKKLPEERCFA